jgi:hypothetical protein
VVYMEPPYRRIVSGRDWYVWDGASWDGTGTGADTGTFPPRPDGAVVVKSAPSLSDDEWAVFSRRMTEARTCP